MGIKRLIATISILSLGCVEEKSVSVEKYDVVDETLKGCEKHDEIKDLDSLPKKEVKQKEVKQKTFEDFLDKLAWRESRGQWKIVNQFGYMGKYQIGKMALKDIGMDSIKVEDFKKNPQIFPEELQDKAVKVVIEHNKKYLRKYINKYKNTKVHGVWITESGIIGAAHLVGNGSVKKWLESDDKDYEKVDGNGTTAKSYFELFANYKLS